MIFGNLPRKVGCGGSDFSHKKGGICKIRGSVFLWVFGVHVCVLIIYTISTSILCVSWEEISVESNQQTSDFYKRVMFGKQRHCEFIL